MNRFDLARTVLTIVSSLMVGTYFFANDMATVIDVALMHTLALILIGMIEIMIESNKEVEEDD